MMKSISVCTAVLLLGGSCFAQQWELGAKGGYSIYPEATLSNGEASAQAGFKSAPAGNVFAIQNMYRHLAGEFGYTIQFSKLKVSSGGTEAEFSGQSHAVHYDLLVLGGAPNASIRPYVLGGGGVKVYRGTGKEQEFQTLGNLVALTHTQEVKGLITFGGGIRAKLSNHVFLYMEARDYLTPFPSKVLAPIPPGKLSSWIHDITPMAGISFGF